MSANQGGCLCGGLRYSVKGPPLRVTVCHCRFCQRATGSAYMVEPIFAAAQLEMVTGQANFYRHRSMGSGKMVTVHFCAACGTKLYLVFERFPDIVGVYGGTFDDPNWFPRPPESTKHIFLGVAQKGTVIPGGLPVYWEHALSNDGEARAPEVFESPHVIDPDASA